MTDIERLEWRYAEPGPPLFAVSGRMAAVRCLVVVLYVVALGMQLGGAGFVIHDVYRSIRNMRTFKEDWDEGKRIGWPEPIEGALGNWVIRQNEVRNVWRWVAVVLLLGGVLLGFAGNVLSLQVSSANPSTIKPAARHGDADELVRRAAIRTPNLTATSRGVWPNVPGGHSDTRSSASGNSPRMGLFPNTAGPAAGPAACQVLGLGLPAGVLE
jgi:hypothetical protein